MHSLQQDRQVWEQRQHVCSLQTFEWYVRRQSQCILPWATLKWLFPQVINYANNKDRADKLLEELHGIPSTVSSPTSPRFEAIQADAGDRASIKRLVEETVSKFGRLDVVFSNHGWTRITTFANLDEGMADEDWVRRPADESQSRERIRLSQ